MIRTLEYAYWGTSAEGARGRPSELECGLSLRVLCRGVSVKLLTMYRRDKSGVADSPSLVATIRGALVCPQGG